MALAQLDHAVRHFGGECCLQRLTSRLELSRLTRLLLTQSPQALYIFEGGAFGFPQPRQRLLCRHQLLTQYVVVRQSARRARWRSCAVWHSETPLPVTAITNLCLQLAVDAHGPCLALGWATAG